MVVSQAMVMMSSSDASDTQTERPGGLAMASAEQGEDFYIKFEENMTMEDLMKQLEHYNYSDRFYDDWKMEWDILHDDRWKVRVRGLGSGGVGWGGAGWAGWWVREKR